MAKSGSISLRREIEVLEDALLPRLETRLGAPPRPRQVDAVLRVDAAGPARITTTRSLSTSASSMSWVTNSMVG